MISNHKFTLLIVLFTITSYTSAQNLSGRIIDTDTKAIIGSTVLIKELNQGIVCDENGEFQATLTDGKYNIEYRCIGYESQWEQIVVRKSEKISRTITLINKPIVLQEVIFAKGDEDPAYEIMKKAIDKANYHQNMVQEYEAETYIKSNMELSKVGGLIDKISTVDGIKMSDFKGNHFVQESYNSITFKAPDSYRQVVRAFSSSIPDNMNPKDVMQLSTSSLYLPKFSGLISPLNPKSFSYYNFRYEGFTEKDKQVINKIKVTPKLKDPELMNGHIYIADNSWDIRHADLESNLYGVKQHFIINYEQVAASVYMPITFSNQISLKAIGIEGFFNYYASVKYNRVTLTDPIPIKDLSKAQVKKSLEIKRNDKYAIETDTLATQRDTLYWQQIRNTPLSDLELRSYVVKDSIQQRIDSVRKEYTNSSFQWSDLITGGKLGGDSTQLELKYGGIIGVWRDYNFVDGFGLGQKLDLSAKLDSVNRITISPEMYYTTARKRLIYKTTLTLDYAPLRFGKFEISVGDISSDFNETGVNRIDNAISSLLWGRNRSMLYRKKYINIKNTVALANGLHLGTKLEMADRSWLENNTYYSFFGVKRKAKENIISPSYTDLLAYDIALQYTPELYYRIDGNKKRYMHSKYPTFTVQYSEGFSSIESDNARFRKLRGNIKQMINTDLFSHIDYEIDGGGFLGQKNKMNFADYKHINTSDDLWLITKSPFSSFMLLDAYKASTNKYWFSTQINYYSKYILLKRLPFLQGKLFNEAVHLKYLHTPSMKNYVEVGYSIDIFKSFSVGVHSSFKKFEYDAFGVKLSYNLNLIK